MAKKLELTHLQERFKNGILKGMDAKAAYIWAGYRGRGSVAEAAASRLLRNVKVAAAIEKAQKKAADKAEVTCERILEEYAKIAFLDPTLFYDVNGKLKAIHKLDKTVAAVIVGLDILQRKTSSGEIELTKKIKLIDKKGALDSLARIKGMFNDKVSLGFSAETLNAILSGLPDEYARAVRAELAKAFSSK